MTPSNNILLRMHHTERTKLNNTWYWEIKAAVNDWEHGHGDIAMPVFGVKRGVRILSRRRNVVDEDNLIGGAKPCVDAIMGTRLIWNDTPDCMALLVEQKIDRINPGTYIEVSL